jgi:hypothetical protein
VDRPRDPADAAAELVAVGDYPCARGVHADSVSQNLLQRRCE